MEKSKDILINEVDKTYILDSRQNIDSYINKHEYRRAFGLLILVLERLNETQKNDLISYYSKNMANMGIFGSTS